MGIASLRRLAVPVVLSAAARLGAKQARARACLAPSPAHLDRRFDTSADVTGRDSAVTYLAD